ARPSRSYRRDRYDGQARAISANSDSPPRLRFTDSISVATSFNLRAANADGTRWLASFVAIKATQSAGNAAHISNNTRLPDFYFRTSVWCRRVQRSRCRPHRLGRQILWRDEY